MWPVWLLCILVLVKLYNKLTSGKCYADRVMSGKVVVVTGASSGIGFETALEMAKRGARVVIACRDHQRGQRAVNIISQAAKSNRVSYLHLELTSLASVRRFCNELYASQAKLDVLINNAGAICSNRSRTDDGLYNDEQINHFGPFLLTVLLVPMLKRVPCSRVLLVSSAWHKFGSLDGLNKRTSSIRSYANSKLCNILFSVELARRLKGTGVTVNSLNPGQVNTSLYRNSTVLERLRCLVLYFSFKTPAEGAQTSVYLAIADECDTVSGRYFEDCKEVPPSRKARDASLASQLWSVSERLVGLKPDELAHVYAPPLDDKNYL